MKWNKTCFPENVRTRQENIIVRLPGVIGLAQNAQTLFKTWQLFFDDDIVMDLVNSTNIYIESISQRFKNKSDVRPADVIEMRALIGLLYLPGVYHGERTLIFKFWSRDGTGVEIFPAITALRRFRFLLRCLGMDDIHTREERKSEDNLAPIRKVFEAVMQNCQKHYSVGKHTTIDEMLWACRFRMYIPNKPARYGLKFSLTDPKSFYTLNMEMYCGKQPAGAYSVSNNGFDVVERLCLPISKSRRNVTMDNWFSSVEVANRLLNNHQLTIVGTLRKNKRQITKKEFFTVRPEKSSMFGFTKDLTIVSYIPKKTSR
ncbi:uncharacterized protein LOC126735788 [Anthonomus grandis grandis]|uniref:uncharacterized protein LOC126735788 n=1 Tax=Anthonomus grandis grandis TaxID=2921223 RepID=UPI0021658D95|nr:uncharacterized protein LOC126735788 [Anthonomus grandis grandis]